MKVIFERRNKTDFNRNVVLNINKFRVPIQSRAVKVNVKHGGNKYQFIKHIYLITQLRTRELFYGHVLTTETNSEKSI